jgi:F1F0 ATPase subunit 2
MNGFLSSIPHLDPVPGIALGLVAGVLLGFVHFGSLWWNTKLFTEGTGMIRVLIVQVGRFAVLATVFFILAELGAAPLLAGMAGLLVSRQVVLRRFRTRS